jgi:hypothetical protein
MKQGRGKSENSGNHEGHEVQVEKVLSRYCEPGLKQSEEVIARAKPAAIQSRLTTRDKLRNPAVIRICN